MVCLGKMCMSTLHTGDNDAIIIIIIIIIIHTQKAHNRKSILGEFVKKMGKQSNEWENINSWFKNTKNDNVGTVRYRKSPKLGLFQLMVWQSQASHFKS